jgi:hypothetical protein
MTFFVIGLLRCSGGSSTLPGHALNPFILAHTGSPIRKEYWQEGNRIFEFFAVFFRALFFSFFFTSDLSAFEFFFEWA